MLPEISISFHFCPTVIDDIFYSNAVRGLGKNKATIDQVGQWIKPGFESQLDGRLEGQDLWVSLHSAYSRGFFQYHWCWINAEKSWTVSTPWHASMK